MNDVTKARIIEAAENGKLFFHSMPKDSVQHDTVEICLDCDAIIIPERYRETFEKKESQPT